MPQNMNEELIIKTILASTLNNGGLLNPEQQQEFVKIIRANRDFIGRCRRVEMTNPHKEIDEMMVGQPISERALENTYSGNTSRPSFGKINLEAKKIKSSWNVTSEAGQRNIEGSNFERSVMEVFSSRIGADIELLGFQGDTNSANNLLKTLDGWGKQSEEAHILDADGASLTKDIFAHAIRRMPDEYVNDPGLAWIMSRKLEIDWLDQVANRQTVQGDAALNGSGVKPYGYPIIPVSAIQSNLAMSVTSATPAKVVGTAQDPFEFDETNNTLILDIDNAGQHTVTFPTGTLRVGAVVKAINAVFSGIASDDAQGRLVLQTLTRGSTSEVDVKVASTSLTVLGFTAGAVTGGAAGSSNTLNDGTYLMLANPMNFIWGIVMYGGGNTDGTRVYSEYNKDFDRNEIVAYNQVDYKIENIDAIVKVKNLRLRELM
jgi:HK97 family phage major capsid protein